MHKTKNQTGFTAIEALLVLLTLVIIGGAGYIVAKHVVNKKTASSQSEVSQSAKVPAAAIPYAGWKNFCDSGTKLCFNYPPNWSISRAAGPPVGMVQTVLNNPATVDAQYADYPISFGFPTTVTVTNPLATTPSPPSLVVTLPKNYSFYVTNITNTVKDDAMYKVISGYYEIGSQNIPSVILMDTTTANKLGLKPNQTNTLQQDSFGISSSLEPHSAVMFGAGPISNATYTAAQAMGWLSSSDGATALSVVQSIRNQ